MTMRRMIIIMHRVQDLDMRHLTIDCFYTVILEIFYVGAFKDCLWPLIHGISINY